MGERLSVSIREGVVVLDFSQFSVDHETLLERISEIVPVIEQAVCADEACSDMDDDNCERLLPLLLAVDLTYQAHLHAAKAAANRIMDVLAGRLTGSDVGYPEFDQPLDLDG